MNNGSLKEEPRCRRQRDNTSVPCDGQQPDLRAQTDNVEKFCHLCDSVIVEQSRIIVYQFLIL